MPKSIFITRNEQSDSLFFSALRSKGYQVHGQSLIQFSPIDFKFDKKPDWLFFYSKNGVNYFFNKVKDIGSTQLAAFGQSTANEIQRKTSLDVSFIGTGDASSTAQAFKKLLKTTDWVCFVQALYSIQSLNQQVSDLCRSTALAVYDNQMVSLTEAPTADLYVVTSPMNARSLLKREEIDHSYTFVAIGKTTAQALKSLGMKRVLIAQQPNEESLVEAVINHFKK